MTRESRGRKRMKRSARPKTHRASTSSKLRVDAWKIMDAEPEIERDDLEKRLRRKHNFKPGTINLAYKCQRLLSPHLGPKYCQQLATFWRRNPPNSSVNPSYVFATGGRLRRP